MTSRALAAGAHVTLSVEDNGCGMDEPTARQAFEPFFTTKGAQGSGLGLAMVRGFIRQSGGEVRIWSKRGTGTRVALHLPFSQAEAPAATGAAGWLDGPGRWRAGAQGTGSGQAPSAAFAPAGTGRSGLLDRGRLPG
jgi:hypothetical protein